MALKVTKVDVWAGDLRDVPGGLADSLEQLGKGGGSLDFLIARRSDKHPGAGKVFVTPVTGNKAKDAAGRAGMQHATNIGTLRVEGPDKRGLGAKMTRAVADAGINVRGVSAAVIGGKFVAYFGFDSEQDADRAAGVLKRINGADKRGGKRSAKGKPRTTARAKAGTTRRRR